MSGTRLAAADRLWARAEVALAAGRLEEAFDACTMAHDRVTDIPVAHKRAHERLLVVDRALNRTRDVFVDRLLLALAPVGSFQVLAVWFRLTEDYDRFVD